MYAGVCILDNPYHIDGIYDYEIPVELGDSVTPGRLVTVPFGVRNHVRLALVTELREQSAYQEMKAAIVRGDYNVLVMKDLSRLGRRVSLGAKEAIFLLSQGVRIIGCDDGVDMDKNIDLTTFIRQVFAEDVVTQISTKVSDAIKTRMRFEM